MSWTITVGRGVTCGEAYRFPSYKIRNSQVSQGGRGIRLSARMHVTPQTSLIIINYRIHTTQSPSLRACEYAMSVIRTSAWVLCGSAHGCYADQRMGVMRTSAWVLCGPAHGCYADQRMGVMNSGYNTHGSQTSPLTTWTCALETRGDEKALLS